MIFVMRPLARPAQSCLAVLPTLDCRPAQGCPFQLFPLFKHFFVNHAPVMTVLCDTHEQAVRKLQQHGFDMRQLSIVGRDYHAEEKVVGYNNTGERMMKWGSNGAFWGSIWGMLMGSAFILIPGVGPLLLAGPPGRHAGRCSGRGCGGGECKCLGAALVSVGVPENSVLEYETEIKVGRYILLAHGTIAEVPRAREILGVADALLV